MRAPALLTLALLLAATFFAGCMGDDGEATFAADDLSRLVLQPADLSRVWLQFDEGQQAPADAPPGSRADPARFGRIEGWKARYRRAGSATTRGPLVIESRADLFESESGAKDDLEALGEDLARPPDRGAPWQSLSEPELGDEALAATLDEGAGPGGVRYYLIGWRQDNVTASVSVNGFGDRISVQDALALARKQHRRLATKIRERS